MIFNKLESEAASASTGKASLIDLESELSPDGNYQRVIDGIPIRSDDGIHFTSLGFVWVANLLLPQIANIANNLPTTSSLTPPLVPFTTGSNSPKIYP
ncbi:MAG: hypothetical protein HKL80_05625 [Acidimicrobiales bacterium]|nr:hypothetical protein [Acidimicrobiales bacterium]